MKKIINKMDERYNEQQELRDFGKCYYFSKNHFLKRTFQLVLPVSIFSLILCYSSGFSFFPHSFNVYFSTFLFSCFTHTIERKYMFLVCNGILAFLAKNSFSGSTSSSSASAYAAAELSASGLSEKEVNVDQEVASSSASASAAVARASSRLSDMKVDVDEQVVVATVESSENVVEEEHEQVKESSFGEEKGNESDVFLEEAEEKEDDNESAVTQEEDIAEPEIAVVASNEPSTEELNKKIEEFIRKMKEEIRIEALQQLIAV